MSAVDQHLAMIELQFSVLTQRGPVAVTAPMGFKIVGPLLFAIPDTSSIAAYRNYQWHIHGMGAASFDCTGPAHVQFGDPLLGTSSVLGPFHSLSFPNGYCYADGTRLASFIRETQQWSQSESALRWQNWSFHPRTSPPRRPAVA